MTVAQLEVLVTGRIDQLEAELQVGIVKINQFADSAQARVRLMAAGLATDLQEAAKAATGGAAAAMNSAAESATRLARETALAGDSSASATARYELEAGALRALSTAEKSQYMALAQVRDAAVAMAEASGEAAAMTSTFTKEIALSGQTSKLAAIQFETTAGALTLLTTAEKANLIALAAQRDAVIAATAAQAKHAEMLTGLGAKAVGLGQKLTMGVTLPIVAIGALSLHAAANFDDAMAKVDGAAGAGRQEIINLREAVLQLARDAGRSPEELAQGLYYIESMGYRGAEAMDILGRSARLAAAGMGTTADVSKVAIFALNAYRGTGMTAARAMDVFAASVREGAMAPEEFANALGTVLPYAGAMNVSLDQIGGAMAGMTREGMSAENATTSLRQTLATMEHPTRMTKKALAEVGLTAAQVAKGLSEDLIGTLITLAKVSEKGGDTFERVFPNIRAFSGILALVGKNGDVVRGIMDRVRDSVGTAGKMFDAVHDSPGQNLRQSLEDINTSAIELGEEVARDLGPAIRGVTDDIREAVKWYGDLNDGSKHAAIQVVELVAAIGPLLIAYGKMSSGIKAITELSAVYQASSAARVLANESEAASVVALTGSVSALQVAMAVLAAGAVGWQIGSAVSNQMDGAAQSAGYDNWGDFAQTKLSDLGAYVANGEDGVKGGSQIKADADQPAPGFWDNYNKAANVKKRQEADLLKALWQDDQSWNDLGEDAPKKTGITLGKAVSEAGDKAAKKAAQEYKDEIQRLTIALKEVGMTEDWQKAIVERKYGEYKTYTQAQWAYTYSLIAQKNHLENLATAHEKAADAAKKFIKEEVTAQQEQGKKFLEMVIAAVDRQVAGDKYVAGQQKSLDLMGETSEAAKVSYEIQHHMLDNLNADQQKQALAIAKLVDEKTKLMDADQKYAQMVKGMHSGGFMGVGNMLNGIVSKTGLAQLTDYKAAMDELDIAMRKLSADSDEERVAIDLGARYWMIGQEKIDAAVKKTMELQNTQAWKTKMEGLADATTDAFMKSFDAIDKGWASVGKSMEQNFKDLLGQMGKDYIKSQLSSMLKGMLTQPSRSTTNVTPILSSFPANKNPLGLDTPQGGGDSSDTSHIHMHMNINTPDANSFQNSQGQILSAAGMAIQYWMKANKN